MATPHFSMEKIVPATADLRSALEENIPFSILEQWLNSDRSEAAQKSILAPYQVHGIIVDSDSSGLTRLSAERHVLDVLLLIHRPKVIIHEFGAAVGGQAVGVWKADNTCMFYPSATGAMEVLEQMGMAQKTIQRDCLVQVGIGARQGHFYRINHSFYGPEFEVLDAITEDYIPPASLIWEGRPIPGHLDLFQPFEEAKELARPHTLWSVRYASLSQAVARQPGAYPMPFSGELLASLNGIDFTDLLHVESIFSNLLLYTHACFVKVHVSNPALLLEKQVQLAAGHYLIRQTAKEYGIDVAEIAGPVVILLEENCQKLLSFMRDLTIKAREGFLSLSCGVAYGEVLRELTSEGKINIIGGAPINYASKLAEDAGVPDHVSFLDSCKVEPAVLKVGKTFTMDISRVTLQGTRIRL